MKLQILTENKKWVSEPDLALIAVMIAAMWRQLPFMATMLLAGMQGIPREMMEAAKIDGANNRQIFMAILSYRTSFVELNLGKGAAIGVLWLLILVVISIGYNKLFEDKYEKGVAK